MDLATLRDLVRDLLSETVGSLPTASLDDLIERATQRIESDYSSDHGVTPRQMMASTSGTILSTGFALPSDYLRARSVKIGNSVLRYTAPEQMPDESQQVDATVNIIYYARIPKLVNDTDTNWLLDIASRVYVYATSVEYTIWHREDMQSKNAAASAYEEARDKTGRSNSPRSAGGWQRGKGQQLGYYSVIGENMVFGYS